MKNNFDRLKEEYKEISIPTELNERVNESINNYKREKRHMNKKKMFKGLIAASLLLISSFTIGVNTSESFAAKAEKIPGISAIVKLVSFDSYIIEDEIVNANVNIPAVQGFESETLEEQINEEINGKMNQLLEEGKKRAKEYKKAFIETGGTEDTFRPVAIDIDYAVKSYNNQKLSFSVHYFEALGSSYSETFFYTIDLEKDRLMTLEDLLGEDYIERVNKQIHSQIKEALKNETANYFEGEMGFESITKDQKFYINENSKIVIVFDKYEIAPGSAGEPEFIIE